MPAKNELGAAEVAEMFALFCRWLAGAPVAGDSRIARCSLGRSRQPGKALHPRVLILALFAACLVFQPKAHSEVKEVRRVVIFYELGPSSPAVAQLDREMRAVLENSPYHIELYGDYLETTLFDDAAAQQALHEEVLFRGATFWERTKWMWVALSLTILAVTVLSLYVRLKLEKDRALGLSGMLITAQEKERSRLASEIHDDFSQRMALLALGLENAEETIGSSPNEAVRQVHDLLNSASEIGADLHTFSHRLHSSTLERLGLVPGVSALCKEFAVQNGVGVDFQANDLLRSVHPDVSLCVFRIVQEGLRNLKKHSGAAKAQVQLRMSGQRIVVTIRDEGLGFDVRELGNKEGLGIRSMEERAYLLGGRLKVYSERGKGTEIEASVPLQPKLSQAQNESRRKESA